MLVFSSIELKSGRFVPPKFEIVHAVKPFKVEYSIQSIFEGS